MILTIDHSPFTFHYLTLHSVRNSFTGFVLIACHTFIPVVHAATINRIAIEPMSVDVCIPAFILNIIFNIRLVSVQPA